MGICSAMPSAGLLWSITREEFVGRLGRVEPDGGTGRNVFTPA